MIVPHFLFSQSWVEKMQDPTQNFYDIQREFNDYWENKTIEKGKGWKQFKRWENFIEQRVFPDGVMHPEILLNEYQNLQTSNNQFRMIPPNVWTQVGPDNVPLQANGTKRGIGRVNTISFHPTDPNIIYIGAPAGGFWKSVNGGQTWITTTDFLTNLGVSDIAINPTNPNEIFIITGDRDAGDTYSYGLMKSLDGGLTFNTTSLSFNVTNYYRGNRILIDPNNTDVLIVATSNGIYRSSDGGNTFVNTFSSANLTDIEFHTTNSNIIYGASKGNTSIYKSTDNGINWSQSGNGLPSTNSVVRACVSVTPDNPSVVYALFGGNNNGFYGVYKSIDEGQNWTQQSNSPNLLGWSTTGSDSDGQAWYDLAFAVDPNDEKILFVGGVNCWSSTDDGQNWSLNTHWTGSGGADYMHADEHMLKYNPLNNYIYSGNDGGLYVSTDNGNNWTDISDGLQITQFYSLGVSQTVQDMVITGAQDNGTFLKDGNTWDAVIGGDGMECIIDYTNSNVMYGELYYGNIRKSTNGGNSFSTISTGNGAWETPYILDRNDPNIIYVGYDELEKSSDGGNSWNTITNNETNGGKIDEIAVSKSNPAVLYFSDGPNLYTTTDGGTSWNNISNGLPYKTIKYIAIHPADPDKVWVTFSGYTSGEKVYKSTNGGSSWQNISGTLPNIPINTIVLDETSNLETLYIGTDLGVFTTDSTISDWSGFNNNSLPNVIVSELEIQYQSNKLMASTYGRGLWSIDLLITSPPSANFFASDSMFCNIPATVDFTNTSYYSNSYYWDFGDGNTSTSTSPTHTYSNYGIYTVSLIATGPLGTDSIIAQSLINIDANNPCIITLPASGSGITQTNCNGVLYDVGGPNSNYYDNNDSWITIEPAGSNQITLNFTDFDIEAPSSSTNCNWDYVEIFDGNSTSSPSLGQFCNVLTGSPGLVTSTGGAITILLHADQSVNGRGFELNWSCTYPASAPITSFQSSDTLSCDGTINFTDLSSNGPTSWIWNFGDGNTSNFQNPSHTYSSGGSYTVSLITTNQYGSDILTYQNYVNIIDMNLSLISDSSCGDASLLLQANSTSQNIFWYSDVNGLNQIGSGNSYITPILSNTTTYYAQSEIEFPAIYGAPADNTFGGGSFYDGNRHLIFDNYKSSTLISVLVYSNSSGNRTIELRNSSNAIISDTNIYIPNAPNGVRIYLNFPLPIQNNMQLGINGLNSDLFRNDAGSVFPYNISNIVSITGTNASAGYYYFFYDWEVQKDPCSSNLIAVDAIINDEFSSSQNINFCGGGNIVVGNNIYDSTGNYTDVFTAQNGCDSIIYTNLLVYPDFNTNQNINICDGDQIIVGNNTYDSTGIYTDIFQSQNGCDSIIITNLTVGQNSTSNQNVTICYGSSYTIGSSDYSLTGIYTDTLSTSTCDSIVTTNLTVLNQQVYNQNINLCYGDSVIVGNSIYTNSGIYYDTLLSVNLCDSLIVSNVIIYTLNPITNLQTICDGDTYQIGSNNYTNAGSYTDVLISTIGCDSIVNTFLTVNPNIIYNQFFVICEGEVISVGNSTYTDIGYYIDSLSSFLGCDSTVNTTISWSEPISLLSINGNNIQGQASNGTPPYIYDFYGPIGLISSTSNNGSVVQIIPQINGTYYFIVTDILGCLSDTSFVEVEFVHTSLYANNIYNISVYPNPTNDIVNILLNDKIQSEIRINIKNVLGQNLYSGILKKNIETINLSSYSSGLYFIEINGNKGKYIYPIIKN